MKAHLIYNPVAGPRDARRLLNRACRSLRRRGWTVEARETAKPGDAVTLARQAALADCDVALVAGGDGTVNEAVNGLVGSRTALGVLPVGTGNVWAKQLNVPTYTLANPRRLEDAAEHLAEGDIRSVDVGRVRNRYFLCWAGIGLDAQVTAEMEPRGRRTKRLGTLAYLVALLQVAREFKGVRTRVSLDGKLIRGRMLMVLISNIRQYAGPFQVAREARMDDGLLDVFLFRGMAGFFALRSFLEIIGRRSLQETRVIHRQARTIAVNPEPPLPVQADGDPICTTPISVEVVARALRVLVPPGAPPGLFAHPPDGRLQ
jgi:diacylglycerol kinase (ATP)